MRSRIGLYIVAIVAVSFSPVLLHQALLAVFSFLVFCPRLSDYIRIFLLGVCISSVWGHWQLAHRAEFTSTVDIELVGKISSLVTKKGDASRFTVTVDTARVVAADKKPLQSQVSRLRQVRLSWYQGAVELLPGSQLHAIARIRAPTTTLNPAAGDYKKWLFERNVDAVGYVREFISMEPQGLSVIRVRDNILLFLQSLPISDQAIASLKALIVGVQSDITERQREVLQQTGTVHLLVISGMHIGFLALVTMVCLRWLLPLFKRGDVCYARFYTGGAAIIASGCYLVISGAGLSAQRAWLMLLAFLVSYLWQQYWSVWHRWLFGMAAVLTFSPLAIYSVGFWLSFLAVASLLFISEQRIQIQSLMYAFRIQLAVFFILTPVLLISFSQASLIAPLVNLFAISVLGLILMASVFALPLAMLGVDFAIQAVGVAIDGLWWVLFQFSNWPVMSLNQYPSNYALLLAVIATALLLMPWGLISKGLALALMLPWLFTQASDQDVDALDIWVFDVGQGMAVLVRDRDFKLLYDTGPQYASGRSAFESNVMPALRMWGVNELDMLVLSHGDNDHAGGRAKVLDQYRVGEYISGSQALVLHEGYKPCKAGQVWQKADLTLTVLSGAEGKTENARSCVVLVESPYCSMLLTGDIGEIEEREITVRPVNWLMASHHGSRFGTSYDWLARTDPDIVVVSAGLTNSFGHPHPDMLNRAIKQGASVLSTSLEGAIHLYQDSNDQCRVETYKNRYRRYWN